jgi:MFS family permease
MIFGALPGPAKVLLGIRVLNQVGAFAFAFLAVVAGPHLVTAALTVFGLTALVSRWAGGVLLDRAAPRTLIALGLTTTGLALLALAVARTPWQVLTAIAGTGLAFEIYEPATSELLARVTEAEWRQDAYTLLGTSLAAAGAISGLLAAVLLPFGVRWLLIADAATCLAAAMIALTRLPAGSVPARRAGRWRPPRRLVRLTAGATAYAFGYLAILMFTPFVLLQRGAPAWLPGLTLAAAALAAPVTRKPLAGHPRVALLVCGAFALCMAVTASVSLTVVAYVAWAAAGNALLGHWPALVADAAPGPDRPRWFAFLGLSWGVAQPLVPGVVGMVATLTGWTTSASLAAAIAFVAAIGSGGGR